MARRRLTLVASALVAGLAFAAAASTATPAEGAAPAHHATVVVDTGQGVITRTIGFDADSVTGMQALQLAGAEPVIWTYAGQGGAVCRLFGVGRDAGPGCLGGEGGDARYWAYHRAPKGATKFSYSPVGAGETAVHDGDIEGWRFGLGAAPPFPAPPPTTTAPPATSPPVTAPVGSGGGATGSYGGVGGSAGAATVAPEASDPVTASTLPVTDAGGESNATANAGARREARLAADARRARPSSPSAANETSAGSAASLLLFGVLIVALVVAIVLVRRRRRPVR